MFATGTQVYVGSRSEMVLRNCRFAPHVTLTTSPEAHLEINADFVGTGSMIIARERITIGQGSKLAEYVTVRDANHDHGVPLREHRFVTAEVSIGRDVWIGAKATILPGVRIGDGATVAAGAIVTKDVPPASTVAGVPARVIE